jgi:hypothetical protein
MIWPLSQPPSDDWNCVTVPLHDAPVTWPQVHVVQPRVSSMVAK